MASDTNGVVADLSARAQHELRAAGHVEPTGTLLRDGYHAGRGDTIVTRHNRRGLRTRRTGHVKNGDLFYRHRADTPAAQALTRILNNESGERSATEELRDALAAPFRLDRQILEYQHGLHLYLSDQDPERWLCDALSDMADEILADPVLPALLDALLELDSLDPDPTATLAATPDPSRPDFPGWLTPPPAPVGPPDEARTEFHTWLHTKADDITTPVDRLVRVAVLAWPPWTTHLGPTPENTAHRRQWIHIAGQVAVFRGHWQIRDSDLSFAGPEGIGTRQRAHRWITALATGRTGQPIEQPGVEPSVDPTPTRMFRLWLTNAASTHLDHQATEWIRTALPTESERILADPAWPALAQRLHAVEPTTDPVQAITDAWQNRETDTVSSATKVLHHRLSPLVRLHDTSTQPVASALSPAAAAMRDRLALVGHRERAHDTRPLDPSRQNHSPRQPNGRSSHPREHRAHNPVPTSTANSQKPQRIFS
ncbi:hypothetical protein [Actinosynnema sp. NPDC020468]|uniref:hypothetical protein n=1 Tax=Actinosynnema sp. NPDC020468 TaxID=3154488 RepID=UPI0033DA72B5